MISKTKTRRGTLKLSYAYTEHGITILASVLRSKRAADMNIAIVRVFIAMETAGITPASNIEHKVGEKPARMPNCIKG